MAYKLPNFLAKKGREGKKIMKKEGRDGFKGIEKKKRKKEEAGTCCYVDRTSCEYVRNTFDEFTE